MADNAPSVSRGNKPSDAPMIAKKIPRIVYYNEPTDEQLTGIKSTSPSRYARIEVTAHHLIGNRRVYTFRWVGETWKPVRISRSFLLNLGIAMEELPWKLKQLPDDGGWFSDFEWRCARTDGLNYWSALFRSWSIRVENHWRLFVGRVVMTAMVWGLAYVPSHEVPSWRHIGKRSET